MPESLSSDYLSTKGLAKTAFSLIRRIKAYKRRAAEIQSYLNERPNEWGKFQSEFSAEMNSIFRDILNFEKDCVVQRQQPVDRWGSFLVCSF